MTPEEELEETKKELGKLRKQVETLEERLGEEKEERKDDIKIVRGELSEIPVGDIIISDEQLKVLLRFLEDQGMDTLLLKRELGFHFSKDFLSL